METTSSNGLGKLLPKSIAAKRRRKTPSSLAEATSSNDDVALQRENSNLSNLSRSTTHSDKSPNHGHEGVDENRNGTGKGTGSAKDRTRDGENNGDLITYDSDIEA